MVYVFMGIYSTGCGSGSVTMSVSQQKCQESLSCSVDTVGGLNKSQSGAGVLEDFWRAIDNLCWNIPPKKLVLIQTKQTEIKQSKKKI